nr:metal-sensitive transcriptional regulator [Candidatus Aminicenantes bacterium]
MTHAHPFHTDELVRLRRIEGQVRGVQKMIEERRYCVDIETLLPAAPLEAKAYLAKVNALNAKGMTPLSQAVIHAADALKA